MQKMLKIRMSASTVLCDLGKLFKRCDFFENCDEKDVENDDEKKC